MKNATNPLLKFSLKIIALLAFIYYTNKGFAGRIEYLLEDNNYSTLLIFAVLWLFSIFALLVASFQPITVVRLFWAVIVACTTAVSFGFYSAGGSELEVLDMFELWQARHETGRAFEHFQHAVIKAIIVAVVGFIIIAYPTPKLSTKARKYLGSFAWLPAVPVFIFASLIFIKSDKAVEGLPQQFAPISMAGAIIYKSVVYETPVRGIVKTKPETASKLKHLLYLVDESINPSYLYSTNGKLLEGLDKHQDKTANFGISVSGSNCSARSNAILRLGASRDNLIESVRTSPTIWQYAKKAGFRTIYIDAQASEKVATKPNDFQNYMTAAEAKYIDVFNKIKDVPGPQLDYKLLEMIKKELASDVPTFIYANKNGAHFPYIDNYPSTEAIYQPVTLHKPEHGLGSLIDLYNNGGGIEAVINTYKNSISWTVDKFFRRFFNEINLDQTVVIYTSDHGQYLHHGSTTHCTSGEGAPVEEGLVPLMLMTSNQKLLTEFNAAAKNNYNNTDHFSIFPTVLNLLGYSSDVQKVYGPNLFNPVIAQKAAFNTGDILGIISMDTIWREVTAEERLSIVPDLAVPAVVSHGQEKN